MIRLVGPIKGITAVAVSGGPDSMAALSFIQNANPNIAAIYFDHKTEHGKEAKTFLQSYCESNNITLVIGELAQTKPKQDSWEEFWRTQRYHFLHSLKDHLIATAHHLNDVAETYLWGCAHGTFRFIHYRQPSNNKTNIIRPFLLTPKTKLLAWCHRHSIPYIKDGSNNNLKFTRNRIRHKILPEIEQINPGFLTTITKLVKNRLQMCICKGGTNYENCCLL